MAGHAAIKDAARRELHERAQLPAMYISGVSGVVPRPVGVRLHTKAEMIGQLTGSKAFAEKAEVVPRIIVLRDQIPIPRNTAIFSFGPGEAYRISSYDPPDGITITCHCTRLSEAETVGLPVPAPGAV